MAKTKNDAHVSAKEIEWSIQGIYDAVISNTPDFVYLFGLDHRFLYANKALLKMWGKTSDEAIGKSLEELGYEQWHADMHHLEIDKVVETRSSIRGEVPFNGTEGRRIYEYIFSPVLDNDGTVTAVAGTTRDVTERKKIEEALRRSEERISLSLAAAEYIGTWDWDLSTGLMVTEDRFARLFSLDPAWAARGAPIEAYVKNIHPEDLKLVTPAIEKIIREGGAYSQEYRRIAT